MRGLYLGIVFILLMFAICFFGLKTVDVLKPPVKEETKPIEPGIMLRDAYVSSAKWATEVSQKVQNDERFQYARDRVVETIQNMQNAQK